MTTFLLGIFGGFCFGLAAALVITAAKLDDLVNENLRLKFELERNNVQ